MVTAISAIYGDVANCIVVPMPCGNSGPGCFSDRLAREVAKLLNINLIDAFEPIADCHGSSHPKANLKRTKMKIAKKTNQTVLLIDDVATSGSHISEAASLLKQYSPQVWPIVWIAN